MAKDGDSTNCGNHRCSHPRVSPVLEGMACSWIKRARDFL